MENENYISQISSFIQDENLNKEELADTLVALSMLDKFSDEKTKLSYDILVSSDDNEWNTLLKLLNITPKRGKRNIYDISKYALLCDILTIYHNKNKVIKINTPKYALKYSEYIDKSCKYDTTLYEINSLKNYLSSIIDTNVVSESDTIISELFETLNKVAPDMKFGKTVIPIKYKNEWAKTRGISFEDIKVQRVEKTIKDITSSIILGLEQGVSHSLRNCLVYTNNTMKLLEGKEEQILFVNNSVVHGLGDLRNCLCNKFSFNESIGKYKVDLNAIYNLVLIFYSKNNKDLKCKKELIGGV